MPDCEHMTSALQDIIEKAKQKSISGKLAFMRGQEELGAIMFSRGKVAWAVCAEQKEDLGMFMRRLGHVSEAQLKSVRDLFLLYKGKKKLGAIMEECGIIKRPLLRRCLLLHIRRAMEALSRQRGVVIGFSESELAASEELLFAVDEIRAESQDEAEVAESESNEPTNLAGLKDSDVVLSFLDSIHGHLGSAIISVQGKVVAAKAGHESFDPSALAHFLPGIMEASTGVMESTTSMKANFVILENSKGALVARWLNEDKSRFLVILLDRRGNIGMARHKIASALTQLMRPAEGV